MLRKTFSVSDVKRSLEEAPPFRAESTSQFIKTSKYCFYHLDYGCLYIICPVTNLNEIIIEWRLINDDFVVHLFIVDEKRSDVLPALENVVYRSIDKTG